MVQNSKVQNRTFPIRLNTVLYIAFSLSGIIIWLTNKDISTAVAYFCPSQFLQVSTTTQQLT